MWGDPSATGMPLKCSKWRAFVGEVPRHILLVMVESSLSLMKEVRIHISTSENMCICRCMCKEPRAHLASSSQLHNVYDSTKVPFKDSSCG